MSGNAGPEDSVPQSFVEMGGSYYFTASTSDAGRELWKSDGTEAGTSMVMDIYPGNMSSNPSALYAADGQLYFSANSWLYARALETINGNLVFVGVNGEGVALRGATTNSIVKLSPIDAGPTSSSLTLSNTVQLNGKQFMGVYLNGQIELWSTDGTEAGTNPLTSNPFAYYSPLQMVATNTKVFAVGLGPTGVELWTSDGTVAGTTLVTTLSFQPDWIVAYQDQVVIAGNGGLWASDGSESELRLIASMSGTFAQTPTVWQDALYFNGSVDGVDGIWKLQDLESPTLAVITDSSGLRFIKTVANANAIAFTIAPPIIGDVAELWITRDGFATKNFVASNVLQMEFAGGMLYYSEGVPG